MKTLTKGFLKRGLSVFLVLMMVLSLFTVAITSTAAADVTLADAGANPAGVKLYLKPNANWTADSARFALYVFNNTTGANAWVSMTVSEQSDIYEAVAPSGTWEGVIFCRMNPSNTTNSWDTKWNQTSDLTYDGTNNLYKVAEGAWDNGDGSWSTFVSAGTGEETGSNTATIYLDFGSTTTFSSASYLYVWEKIGGTDTAIGANWPGAALSYDSATGYYYRTFKYDNSYRFIVNNGSGTTQTEDSDEFTAAELLVKFTGSTTYETEVLTEESSGKFWVDLNPDVDTSDIDLLYPEYIDGAWILFLPSSADASALEFHMTEDCTLTISNISVADGGTIDLSSGVNTTGTLGFPLGGSFSGYLKIKQSANVSAIYTTTETSVPQGINQGYPHKDDYESENASAGTGDTQFIMVVGADGTVKLEESILKKIKGRGNSSWEASDRIIGKYAFNITLDSKAKLLDESAKSKKYCLVSYNADEARMRNMIVYELAQQIGVDYVADYEPVDLYNNGKYIGSYLLTDKVEIGDPLVDIYDIDGANEDINEANGVEIDDSNRGFVNGNKDTNNTKGFYKYINMDYEDTGYIDAQSGFLLEFELNERFADEISGFISTKGQQIVCKYPELASKSQIEYIMNIWNTAEAVMYDDTATYEELNAVIDVESFAKMYLIQELTKNLDGGATSYYVYYHEGKLHAGCAWDYDWTLGQYAKEFSERVNNSSDFANQIDGNPGNYGGWYLNSKNIYGASILNAQAALCQNDNFWNVVTAEWNELFYSEALTIADSTVNSVSELDGTIAEFYTQVHASTEMDEVKWGLIEKDLLANQNGGGDWGSADTGETHDAAVVALNNWYYNRLNWMNQYLTSESYTLATPTLTADKDTYQVGETVTLTAESNSSGMLTYNFYDAQGTLLDSVDSDTGSATYSYEAIQQGTAVYSVTVTSDNTSAETDAAEAEVLVEGFSLIMDVTAPESVQVGDNIVITATSNTDETVTYNLLDEQRNIIETNTTGEFIVPTTAADKNTSKYYAVEASVTVDGQVYKATYDFIVSINEFTFSVNLSTPTSVEAGMVITLNATAVSNSTVTYEFYNAADDTLITTNTTGIYNVDALQSEIGTSKSYYVVAKTTVAGTEYTATSETKTVSITAVAATYDVTIYFKSTSTLGYKPLITTAGAVENLADAEMTKEIFIAKNATQTASYYWYKAEVQVSKASPTLSVSILSSRYAMEGDIDLTITQSGEIYLAVDNLNEGYEMLNLTDWTEDERNWCESAVHMVYDAEYDGEESLAAVAANVNLTYVGDANNDGKVNIKDATLIQKFIAGLVTLDDLGMEISDVNSDGKVTVKDATAIQKKLVALL